MNNLKLSDREWREFSFSDIFTKIQRGKRLTKSNQTEGDKPYVSSTAMNNGVDNFIGNKEDVRVFENCLSLANSGSVGSVFYHHYSFVGSDHITALELEKPNKYVYLFLSGVIKRLEEKYSFNREINDVRIKREKILLPVKISACGIDYVPDWQFVKAYAKQIQQQKIQELIEQLSSKALEILTTGGLKNRAWKEFKIGDLFDVNVRGRRLIVSNRQQGKIPFVTAGESQNGISSFINNEGQTTYSNAITLDMFGNAFYQKFDFKCDDNITVLINENVNQYSAFFIVTLLNRLREKYSYGNQVRPNRLKNDKILLPIDQNENPDWQFMEDFMRKIEQDKVKTILEYYKNMTKCQWGGVNRKILLSDWQSFEIENLFEVKIGKNIDGNKVDREKGKYAYITRKENTNGLDGFIDYDNDFLNLEFPIITIGNETAEPFVQNFPFFTGTKVNILIPKNSLSKEILFFIATSLKQHKNKYSYSFTINSTRLKKQKILLPTKNNRIDWQGMEDFIKQKELEKLVEILEYYNNFRL